MKRSFSVVNEDIGKFGMWVNDHIVGNAFTFVLAILSVLLVYAAIPFVGGYSAWNTGLGLFFNTLSSSFELITGIGAVVGVVVLHSKVKNQASASEQRHDDLLDLHETHAANLDTLQDVMLTQHRQVLAALVSVRSEVDEMHTTLLQQALPSAQASV